MFNRSKKDYFLLEIGTEELPANQLRILADSLHDNICEGIRSAGLTFVNSQIFATPRRIAVLLKSLDGVQAAKTVEKRGPAADDAYDANGQPSKALEGFAKSCGVPVEQLEKLSTDKGSWFMYRKTEPGVETIELMPQIITEAIRKIPQTKPMRWADHAYEFLRPVHWLVAMYGRHVVPLQAFGKTAGNISYGHRFMAPQAIKIGHAEKYSAKLQKNGKVLADFKIRRETIKQQIFQVAEPIAALPVLEDKLLDEVTNLVEWPMALLVDFDPSFLTVPQAALVAVMQKHQKCFALTDQSGDLLPQFITVSNIQSKDPAKVIAGNKKVMRARLADAKFFYENDLKHSLESRIAQLKTITFEEQLGSLYDRTERIVNLSRFIAKKLNTNVDQVSRAALLCKTDLVTGMVGEFPELQGIMGSYYAKHDGEPEDISTAIREHYHPNSAADVVSKQPLAYIVGIADKIDLLVGIFGIGNKPTGDKDPFGLRRATIGAIRLIVENNLSLDFSELVKISIEFYQKKFSNRDVYNDVMHFFYERLRAWYKDQGVNNYIFNAVLAKQPTQLQDFANRVNAVMNFKRLPEALRLAEAQKRVSHILAKNAEHLTASTLQKTLLVEEAEQHLAQALADATKVATEYYQQQNYKDTLRSLVVLKKPIDEFFEKVMVMTDDMRLRQNRLLLLKQLQDLFNLVADISLLQ